jgi:hypothetical protein
MRFVGDDSLVRAADQVVPNSFNNSHLNEIRTFWIPQLYSA